MQKIIVSLFVLSVLCSCDYSTSSNGNVDAAFAREDKPAEDAHHGSVDATEHKNNDPKDHIESHATQGAGDAIVVPTDSSESGHAAHPTHSDHH